MNEPGRHVDIWTEDPLPVASVPYVAPPRTVAAFTTRRAQTSLEGRGGRAMYVGALHEILTGAGRYKKPRG